MLFDTRAAAYRSVGLIVGARAVAGQATISRHTLVVLAAGVALDHRASSDGARQLRVLTVEASDIELGAVAELGRDEAPLDHPVAIEPAVAAVVALIENVAAVVATDPVGARGEPKIAAGVRVLFGGRERAVERGVTFFVVAEESVSARAARCVDLALGGAAQYTACLAAASVEVGSLALLPELGIDHVIAAGAALLLGGDACARVGVTSRDAAIALGIFAGVNVGLG